METLGYGTHLLLDGFKADERALADEAAVRAAVLALAQALEPRHAPDVLLEHLDGPLGGHSAAALLAESHLTLHTFPAAQRLSASVFSRHGLDVKALSELLSRHCGARRFESHLKNHGRTMAKGLERRRRTLLGDRQYAALRLQDQVIL